MLTPPGKPVRTAREVRDRTETMPAGTVTFLMTDIEGSTRLWEERREAMAAALEAHDTILRNAIEARALGRLREGLEAEALASAWSAGRQLTPDAAVSLALAADPEASLPVSS